MLNVRLKNIFGIHLDGDYCIEQIAEGPGEISENALKLMKNNRKR